MAEAIVSISIIISKLHDLLQADAKLLSDLPKQIRSVTDELESIKAVLKDAENQAEGNNSVKEWLRQVREVAYKIEDAIDDYFLLNKQKESQQAISFSKKIIGKVVHWRAEHELASTVKDITVEIQEISDRRKRYQFTSTSTEQVSHHEYRDEQGGCSFYMDMDDDTELVGIKTQKEDMIKFCKEPSNGRRGNRVIAVVGMGGLGKTTLVREVYKEAWKDFESFAWIAVSRSNFNRLDILKSIYKQFLETPGHVNDKLQQVLKFGDIDFVTKDLRDHLEQNRSMRYLVVLDDVWDGSEQLVTDMKAALPIHLNDGSRILLTTRNEDVAKHWTTILGGRMYEQLQPLPFDKAWSLFCKKLFGENNCPRDLEELSYEIVMKCDGLPLAIVAVAGLLSTKRKVVSEWRQVHDRLSSEFGSNSLLLRCTRRILLLSYQELPYHLKPCFLYFGLFPEDYSIQGMRLVRLWIAEGFIPHARDKTVEEVAQEYLVALVKRNLVQVSQRDSTGRSRSFHIHDLFREVIHSKLEEIGFSKVLSKDNNNNNNNSPGLSHFRRLSIHDSSLVKKNKTTGNIHSVLSFDGQNQTALPSWLDTQPKYLRYLKILDLQDAPIYHIPENSGDLYHL